MCTLDNEAHSALDWAADYGDVNVLEFFVRKGLNPFRVDGMGRTALYWAVKSNRYEAARFLMMCGCDPRQKDYKEQTPLQLAQRNGFREVYRLLKNGPGTLHKELPDTIINSIHCIDPASTPKLYQLIHSEKRSHAVYLHRNSSVAYALAYACFFATIIFLTAFIPFYVWIAMCMLIVYIYRRPILPEPDPKVPHYRSLSVWLNVSDFCSHVVDFVTDYEVVCCRGFLERKKRAQGFGWAVCWCTWSICIHATTPVATSTWRSMGIMSARGKASIL